MSYKQGTVQHRDSLRTEGIKFHYYRKKCDNKMEKWLAVCASPQITTESATQLT